MASSGSSAILDEMRLFGENQGNPGARKVLNSELWHACAGPLVSLPQPGSLVYYFPQGHSEQVTASTRKISNSHIPNYPALPPQLLCQVHNVTLHADKDTDEIYAQMTLQPVNAESDVFQIPNFGQPISKQPNDFFCKNLTASDTSTHGGFSVPRRAAEKLFPQLDYSMQPPNQELIVRDLHDNMWTFRHIYRGQPKRHLLTTGWSMFVGTKRLKAGDSVLFIRDEKSQLLLGVRRANRQQTALPSSVLSTDSMHIGVLAAAAHAAASRSPFTIYYNPRACPSDFIIPLVKYQKAAYTQVSVGMRFGMMFETEESTKRRHMGTIVGISDFDPLRWPNSKWRNLQVEWDEHGSGERPDRVSLWEIETPESLFVFPTPSLKRQCLPGFMVPGFETGFRNCTPLSQAMDIGTRNMHPIVSGVGSDQLMKMLLTPRIPSPDNQLRYHQSIYASILQRVGGNTIPTSLSSPGYSTVRNPMQQEPAVSNLLMQQNQLSQIQQQILPSENIALESRAFRCNMEQQVGLDGPPTTHLQKPEEKFSAKNVSEKNLLVQAMDFRSEKQETNQDSSASQENAEESVTASEQAEFSEKHDGVNDIGSPNHEIVLSPIITDQEPESRRLENPHSREEQLESTAGQLPNLPHSLDKSNFVDLPSNHGYNSSHHENWIPQPSSLHSLAGPSTKEPEFFSGSGVADSLFLLASDVTTSLSADISSIMNPLSPFESFPFTCFSDPHTTQCLTSCIQETFSAQEVNTTREMAGAGVSSSDDNKVAAQEHMTELRKISNSCSMRDLSDARITQSDAYSNPQFEVSNGNMITSSSISSTVYEGFRATRNSGICVPSEDLFSSFTCNQDMQSQVTSAANLADSQLLPLQDVHDGSGGTSSCSMDISDCNILNRCSMKQVQQPLRTYTKVQKLGSVGRSIDVTCFKDYHELRLAIACMFGLEGQLEDPRSSEWKLVYVDYENDVLLVGDDPWEDFVKCVRCIRILSPSEVQQMSEEGIQLMNSHLPPYS